MDDLYDHLLVYMATAAATTIPRKIKKYSMIDVQCFSQKDGGAKGSEYFGG